SIFNPGWTNYLERYFYIKPNGNCTYEGEFHYVDDDIIGGDENKIEFGCHTGVGNWDDTGGIIYSDVNKLHLNVTDKEYYVSGIQLDRGLFLNLKVFLQGAYR
ncbi:MAG: hypothetical protein JXA68_03195, partial [Ignavibacteriales bacterium]|nr:hypothetical protein [Ignavibacteriales bacterium]